MHSTTVAVDLAKNVFELAVADSEGKIGERLRLNRARFSSFFVHRAPCRVLMEACGSAHYWARRIGTHGHTVQLLPAQYVRQYVRRNRNACTIVKLKPFRFSAALFFAYTGTAPMSAEKNK